LHSAASPTALCVSEPSALRCQRVWRGCWLVGSVGRLCPSPPVEVWVLPLRVSLSPETEPEALTWLTLPVVQLRVWRAHCQRLRVVLRAVACGCPLSSCLVCSVAINQSDQTFANGCSVCDWLQPTSALGFARVDCSKLSLAKPVDRWKRSCLLRTRCGFAALTRGPVAATALLLRPLGRWGWTEHPPATRCAAGAARGGGGTWCDGTGPDACCEGGQRKLIVVVS